MDRFVVGTGRCGSTLLSRMLAEHPRVLSLFEFFTGLDMSRRFVRSPVGGHAFAELIAAEQPFVTAVLRRGYDVEEITYPFGRGRYRRDDPMPWLSVTMLPRLTDDPDALFDELVAFAASLPLQTLDQHYRRLFTWLAERFGREAWIERSGSSIEYLEGLHRTFPDARFLHLHRDGPEVALSMREHHAYRLPISLLYDVPLDSGARASELGAVDVTAPPTGDDPVSQILTSRPPAEHFGRYWTDQIVRGLRGVTRLRSDRYLEVAFEDLVAEPRETLARIAEFFELGGGDAWLAGAAGLVRGIPPTRADKLAADERARLEEACRVGRQILGRSV